MVISLFIRICKRLCVIKRCSAYEVTSHQVCSLALKMRNSWRPKCLFSWIEAKMSRFLEFGPIIDNWVFFSTVSHLSLFLLRLITLTKNTKETKAACHQTKKCSKHSMKASEICRWKFKSWLIDAIFIGFCHSYYGKVIVTFTWGHDSSTQVSSLIWAT